MTINTPATTITPITLAPGRFAWTLDGQLVVKVPSLDGRPLVGGAIPYTTTSDDRAIEVVVARLATGRWAPVAGLLTPKGVVRKDVEARWAAGSADLVAARTARRADLEAASDASKAAEKAAKSAAKAAKAADPAPKVGKGKTEKTVVAAPATVAAPTGAERLDANLARIVELARAGVPASYFSALYGVEAVAAMWPGITALAAIPATATVAVAA
jgi:hypothetical protein